MVLTTIQFKKTLAAGGSLVINGPLLTLPQLTQLAKEVAKSSGSLTIKNVGYITSKQLEQIAAIAPGQIIFDLTT